MNWIRASGKTESKISDTTIFTLDNVSLVNSLQQFSGKTVENTLVTYEQSISHKNLNSMHLNRFRRKIFKQYELLNVCTFDDYM